MTDDAILVVVKEDSECQERVMAEDMWRGKNVQDLIAQGSRTA